MAEKKTERDKTEQEEARLGPSKLDEIPHDAVRTEDGYIYPDSGSVAYTFGNTGEKTNTEAGAGTGDKDETTAAKAKVTARKAPPVVDEPKRPKQ